MVVVVMRTEVARRDYRLKPTPERVLKSQLRGASFAEGEAMLSPVQMKPAGAAQVQREEGDVEEPNQSVAPAEEAPAAEAPAAEEQNQSVAPAEEAPAAEAQEERPPGPRADEAQEERPPGPWADEAQEERPPGPWADEAQEGESAKEGGAGEAKEGEAKEGEEPPEVKGEMEFPAGDCFGFAFGVTSKDKGGAFVKGFAKGPHLPELNVPICTGVFFQAKPEIKGGFTATKTGSGWELELAVTAACAATIRGGMPKIASVGAGIELEGKISTSIKSSGDGWTGAAPSFSLTGAPIIDIQILEASKKLSLGEVELLKLVPTGSGYSVQLGSGVQAIASRLLAEDEEARRAACHANNEGGGAEGAGAAPVDCGD